MPRAAQAKKWRSGLDDRGIAEKMVVFRSFFSYKMRVTFRCRRLWKGCYIFVPMPWLTDRVSLGFLLFVRIFASSVLGLTQKGVTKAFGRVCTMLCGRTDNEAIKPLRGGNGC